MHVYMHVDVVLNHILTFCLDPLHLEMVVMNHGIQMTKLEREMQFVRSQQEVIMQRLIEIESWFRSSYQPLASTPHQHHTQMNFITTNPLQYLQTDSISTPPHQQKPLHQQFFPPATAASQPNPSSQDTAAEEANQQ